MHQPESNQFALIDQLDFNELRRSRPVYEGTRTVIVDPETFENTPKLTAPVRLPYHPTADEVAARLSRSATATAISSLRSRDKKRRR